MNSSRARRKMGTFAPTAFRVYRRQLFPKASSSKP
jgi:hypothetical protein